MDKIATQVSRVGYLESGPHGFWMLFLTALARLFLTNLMLLSTGCKGGQFLPMFGGAAPGLLLAALFPVVPAPVAALAAMGALVAAVLPKSIIALVLMVLIFPLQYVRVSIMTVGIVIIGQLSGNELAGAPCQNRKNLWPVINTWGILCLWMIYCLA